MLFRARKEDRERLEREEEEEGLHRDIREREGLLVSGIGVLDGQEYRYPLDR